MNMRFALLILLSIVCGIGLHPHVAVAGGNLEDEMNRQLGVMINTSNPKYVETARRGIISGGSITIKNKVMNAQWASFTPPRIKGGCGGWDIFGGAFSFISSEQIVAMLRSIASNAIAVAFETALESISPQLAGILKRLQSSMDAVNQSQMNSCKISTAIGDAISGKGEWDSDAMMEASGLSFLKDLGFANDDTAASNQGKKEGSLKKASEDASTPEQKEIVDVIIGGNMIFNILAKGDSNSWVGSGSGNLREQIMSLTGTLISCIPGEHAGCQEAQGAIAGGQEGVIRTNKAPVMKFRDFVEGSSAGREIKQYKCDTDNIAGDMQCLNPTIIAVNDMLGVKDMLRKKLCGDTSTTDCASDTGGFIGRYRLARNGDAVSDEDRKLMGALGNYTGMIMNLTAKNELAARGYVDAMLPAMASMIAFNVVAQALNATQVNAATYKGGRDRGSQDMIMKAANEITDDYKKYTDDSKVDTTSMDYYERLIKATDKHGDMVLPYVRE